MSSQESDTQFFVDVVNEMDCEEEEEDHFLAGAVNQLDREEEEEEDQFLAAVPYDSPPSPYVPPPPAVPYLDQMTPCSSSLHRTLMRCPPQTMTRLHHHNK